VPGLRLELVTALIRSLPKELRRPLVPVPDVAAQLLERLQPRRKPLLDALSRELERLRGVRVPREAWDVARLPAHLRMTFRLEDERGERIAAGDNLARLRQDVRPQLRAQLTAALPGLERSDLRAWTIGDLPRHVELPGAGVHGYPALVDEGGAVGVRVLESPEAQEAAMRAGTRRLLRLTVPSPLRHVRDRLGNAAELAIASAPHGSVAAALEDAIEATVDALVVQAGGPAWDEAGFAQLRGHVAGHLADATAKVVAAMVRILDAARDVERRLQTLTAEPLQPARRDVEEQLGRLVHRGFVTEAGVGRLPDIERYLRAAARRLERLPAAQAADLDRMGAVHELEHAYRRRIAALPPGATPPAPLRELPWLLEELRVSHFAQALGTRGPVSSKRIRRALE
jgi:ATP-dependent helicase HrpA